LVVPEIAGDDHPEIAILESELVRAIEFGKAAENPTSITDLQRIAVRFGVDYVKLLEGGIEDD